MAEGTPIVFSVPTSGGGATAAATFSFYTSGYKLPRQNRSMAMDRIHNQNGRYNYAYDNGPGSRSWEPFQAILADKFEADMGDAATQMARLQFLWNYVEGPMGMAAPDGVYSVVWAEGAALEPKLLDDRHSAAGDKLEWRVLINLEEG